jgi:hypothetical protein
MKLKEDIQAIINYSHFFAEHCLKEMQEFYPFGASIDQKGELQPIGFGDEENTQPDSNTVINALQTYFEKEFSEGQIRAYGICYDVCIQINEQGEKSDAVAVDIVHQEGESVPIYYFPYQIKEENEIAFGKSFGIKRARTDR